MCPKMIKQKIIILDVSNNVILRNVFASVKLKYARGLPVKLNLDLIS